MSRTEVGAGVTEEEAAGVGAEGRGAGAEGDTDGAESQAIGVADETDGAGGPGVGAEGEAGVAASEVDEPGDGGRDDGGEEAGRRGRGRWWWVRGRVVGGVVAVLLVAGGGLGFYQGHALRSTDAARNKALTDAAATARVNGDVSSALAKIFSYTPDGTEATERAARALLDGRAAEQWAQLFAQVRADVRDQKVTLSTQTVRVGTVSLRGDTAHLLAFLDQTAVRGDKKPTTSAAQLSVTAQLRGDVWRIVDIKAR